MREARRKLAVSTVLPSRTGVVEGLFGLAPVPFDESQGSQVVLIF